MFSMMTDKHSGALEPTKTMYTSETFQNPQIKVSALTRINKELKPKTPHPTSGRMLWKA
jgi:hypothetical protein